MPSYALSSIADPNRPVTLGSADDWFSQQGAPAPTSTVPPVGTTGTPEGWVTEEGLPARPPDLQTALQQANQIAYGGKGNEDANYWAAMWAKDPGYTWKRMLGWQAGGKDMATSGPYAGQAGGGGGMGAPIGGGAPGELETSPGFQFRLGEGLKSLARSAAARGTLLTGGTLKGLQRYAQDYASGEYQNRFNQLYGLSQLGLNAAGQQAGTGSQYAGLAGNLLTNQATNLGNALTGAGNAASAGTIASGNAWQQGLGGLSNLAQQYYLMSLMGGGGGGAAGSGGAAPATGTPLQGTRGAPAVAGNPYIPGFFGWNT